MPLAHQSDPPQGQTLVPPTDAQIAFTSVPVWSALLAAAVLPDEPITPATLLGGALVLLAGLVAALASRGGGSGGGGGTNGGGGGGGSSHSQECYEDA